MLAITDGVMRFMAVKVAAARRQAGESPEQPAEATGLTHRAVRAAPLPYPNIRSSRRQRRTPTNGKHQSSHPDRQPDRRSRALHAAQRHVGVQAPAGREPPLQGQSSGEWIEKPNYFDIKVWGAQGENCAQYLSKGRPVAVDGRLEWREWESQDGGKR